MASIDERLVDKRIVERNIERGLLDDAVFQKYLQNLTDMEENAEVIHQPVDALDAGRADGSGRES